MRFRALTVVVAILALAGTAVGQRVRVKEHDKKDKKIHEHAPPPQQGISVTGFAPQTGPVGAVVAISGSGFLPQTKVVVGGRPVKTDAQTATAITFTVPARYGDGVIVLRHPGAANDVMVGTFVVQLAPEIVRFLPIAGPAGTRVEIAGAGFANGDQVLFNGKALSISELGPTRIVVTIPPGATSDFFVLARPSTGQKDQARKPFNVTLPPPAITGFSPTSGPPGTTVRLSGANFAQTDRVYYGGTGLLPSNRGEGWVEVQIPPNARQNFPLTVRNQRGEAAVTQQPFALVLPPAITAFNPAFGPAGARVEILGAAFMKGDEVRLGARALKVLDLADGRITVEIPADGRTDLFAIFRGGAQVAVARAAFVVVVKPVITSFQPASGTAGTHVILSGSGFAPEAVVLYGAQRLKPLSRTGETQIEVAIPAAATSQPFVVQTRGGEAQSAGAFTVQVPSRIASVSPQSGPVGTRVWIRGANFNPTDAFYLSGKSLAIVEKQPEGYLVTIPAGAQSGFIEWETYGRREASKFRFEVIEPPQLASFTPLSGPAAAQVTITGANFTARTAVFFGAAACTIIKRTLPTSITVMIPPNAAGTDYLYVEDGGQRLKSPAAFQVIAPPVFGGFAPASGPTGSQVTINGQNLGGATRVWFGALECQVVKRVGATQIVVTVPAAAKGKDFFTVEDGAQRVRAAQAFEVTVPAAPPPAGHAEHEHAHEHPHEVGDHHHHPHAHPHRPGTNHHHPY